MLKLFFTPLCLLSFQVIFFSSDFILYELLTFCVLHNIYSCMLVLTVIEWRGFSAVTAILSMFVVAIGSYFVCSFLVIFLISPSSCINFNINTLYMKIGQYGSWLYDTCNKEKISCEGSGLR